ncbi:MAG: dynamin family protein [Pseudomonadota bacterium]
MNVLNASDELAFLKAKQQELLSSGLEGLRTFTDAVNRLRDALFVLSDVSDESAQRRIDRMLRQLDGFEPSVTMIGQIKSGKTSLVNALIGAPDLLPADVNPWTSVVTSLHLHPEDPAFENHASFRFFDEDEWDRLVSGGGRIGELASRAGADDELEKIKAQVAEMREKSRARLGRKFEVLLGQQRDYGFFDKELIERYVCLGEEPDADEDPSADMQGRFADITKSADLHMTRMAMPMRLCIRDTPGVNDTFMMREQITIRAVRDSRMCVVVLSAHQALSSTDMALIRLISQAKSRDIIIFVNRVDELSDPMRQIPQIRESVENTLKKHKGPVDAEVIFGSAIWAQHALQMRLEDLPPASAAALENWQSDVSLSDVELAGAKDAMRAWQASGIPALQRAVAERVAEGAGAALLQRIAASAKNLAAGHAAADRIRVAEHSGHDAPEISIEEARARMRRLMQDHQKDLRDSFDTLLGGFAERLERVQHSFLERATASMVDHLEQKGENAPWTYDPAGLRMLLNSSHKVLARNSVSMFDKATRAVAEEMSQLYGQAFSLGPDDIDIALPRAPQVPAPVSLGRTIALDLSAGWWKRWWRQRRGYKAYAAQFYELIKSETVPVVSELRDDLAEGVRRTALERFDAFLNEQLSVFETLERSQTSNPEELRDLAAATAPQQKRAALAEAVETLNAYATT